MDIVTDNIHDFVEINIFVLNMIIIFVIVKSEMVTYILLDTNTKLVMQRLNFELNANKEEKEMITP